MAFYKIAQEIVKEIDYQTIDNHAKNIRYNLEKDLPDNGGLLDFAIDIVEEPVEEGIKLSENDKTSFIISVHEILWERIERGKWLKKK